MTSPVTARGRWRRERGSAVLEFHLLGIVLLVPLVYVVLAALDVQRGAYGVTQAVREAGRVFVATGNEAGARAAAGLALRDQGLDEDGVALTISCSAAPCWQPGAEVTVSAATTVALPFLPDVLAGAAGAGIPVSAEHVAIVDRFRELP